MVNIGFTSQFFTQSIISTWHIFIKSIENSHTMGLYPRNGNFVNPTFLLFCDKN